MVGAPYFLITKVSVACQVNAIIFKYRQIRYYFAGIKYMDPLCMIVVQFQVTLCHILAILT